MEEEKSLKEIMLDISTKLDESSNKKPKKFKLPRKGKVSKGKLKRGFITIAVIKENKVVDFKKERIIDGTFKLENTYHAVADFDVLTYKGKPFIFQAENKKNPYNPIAGENETYGQKQIMSRMINETLKIGKTAVGWGASAAGIVIIGIIAYALIAG